MRQRYYRDVIENEKPVKRVALAGASGFVGSAIRESLGSGYEWVALTRSKPGEKPGAEQSNTTWHQCDLFSLPQIRQALEGVELAVYMVHSMLPSSRLVQGSFRDTDLLLADNFIRAAEEAGVKRVIYLGGLIPENETETKLSPHLASRLEVERVLQGRSVPVTVLRSGLIVGPGGSSAQMLLNLTRRLPIMILPAWTKNTTQSIDIRDIVRAMGIALEDDSMVGVFDLAGHAPMSYREMIIRTSQLLGKRTVFISVPLNWFTVSRRWVSVFGDTPLYLVKPLLESLRHNLLARPNRLLDSIYAEAVPFVDSIRDAADPQGQPLPHPRSRRLKRVQRSIHKDKRVRSIQRMPLPQSWSALKLTQTYAHWIERNSLGLIHHQICASGILRLSFMGQKLILLEFTPTPYSLDCEYRRAYYITGGILARIVDPPGRFELRIFPQLHCLITAIHGFKPSLPWWLYSLTQRHIHLFVMRRFASYLGKIVQEIVKKG